MNFVIFWDISLFQCNQKMGFISDFYKIIACNMMISAKQYFKKCMKIRVLEVVISDCKI